MKKGILTLWLVGAAIYSVDTLLITGPKSPSPTPPPAEQPSSSHVGNRPLRSWEPYLRGHSPNQPAAPSISALNDDHQHAPLKETVLEAANNDAAPSTTESEPLASAEENWVKVILPAKLHSSADISSPIVNYYPPGTVLRAEPAQNGWVETINPVTEHHGWILEQYLSHTGSPEQLSSVQSGQTTAQKAAPLTNTNTPSASRVANTKLADLEPPARPISHERRHRRAGLFGLFRRF